MLVLYVWITLPLVLPWYYKAYALICKYIGIITTLPQRLGEKDISNVNM